MTRLHGPQDTHTGVGLTSEQRDSSVVGTQALPEAESWSLGPLWVKHAGILFGQGPKFT